MAGWRTRYLYCCQWFFQCQFFWFPWVHYLCLQFSFPFFSFIYTSKYNKLLTPSGYFFRNSWCSTKFNRLIIQGKQNTHLEVNERSSKVWLLVGFVAQIMDPSRVCLVKTVWYKMVYGWFRLAETLIIRYRTKSQITEYTGTMGGQIWLQVGRNIKGWYVDWNLTIRFKPDLKQ